MEKGTTSGKVAKNGAWANLKGALRVRGKGSFSETSSSSIEYVLLLPFPMVGADT